MILHNFIVLEGIDGAGTSTQLDIIRNKPGTERFLFTAEPTTYETGRFIRRMLSGEIEVSNETAAYLFAADRNEHVNGRLRITGDRNLITGIREATKSGMTVISDRYLFSSLAYQSINCSPDVPRMLNSLFPLPTLLVYLDISPDAALKRIDGRGEREIYEKKDFLEKTVAEYMRVLDEYSGEKGKGMKILVLDATKTKEEINAAIMREIKALEVKS
ncbi:MAG: dTMP kinase [Treponema sp.]|nr:dTMP kinase [Treponema sp.]